MRYRKFLIIILLVILLFCLKKNCLDLPAFGDEINYLNGSLAVYKNNLNPFVEFSGYKPPLFYMTAALLYKIFGYSLVISRVLTLFCSFLMLYFTFLLGKTIYNEEIGFFASLLLFSSPFFFAQSGFFYCDILVGALALSTIYFFIKKDILKYIVSAGLLVLTKETGVLIVLSIGAYKFIISLPELIKSAKLPSFLHKIWALIREILLLLSPVLLFFAWALLNKILLGWFDWPLWSVLLKNFSIDMNLTRYILSCAFWVHFRFLITLIILVSVALFLTFKAKRQLLKKEILLFLIMSTAAIIIFGGLSAEGYGYSPRYIFFILPFFLIIGTACIVQLFKKRGVYVIVLGAVIFLSIHSWKGAFYHHELNMDYLNIVKVDKQAADFLENNYSFSMVIVSWPLSAHLTEPALGYVHKPLEHVFGGLPDSTELNKGTIIVTSKFFGSWSETGRLLELLTQHKRSKLLAKFGSGVEEVCIYFL